MAKLFLIFIVLFSSILSWQNMIYQADTLPSFYGDEVPNTQAVVSLFSNGGYRSQRYDLQYSSGIAVTWPGAIGWYLGHNMLAARLACAFFSWALACLLGFWFFRRAKFTGIDSIAASVCLWALTITTPFALPYWFGFMYNLGELNAIILVGFGLLLLLRHPLLSMFIFGMASWHGKFTYLPLVLAIIIGIIFSKKLPLKKMIALALGYLAIFLLPLFIYIGWLVLKFGTLEIRQWLCEQLSWLFTNKSFHEPGAASGFSLDVLRERLTSPKYEWANYALGTKIKDLLFSFGAIGVVLTGLMMGKRRIADISGRQILINIMAVVSIGFYSAFYFFIHPFMWQRHFLPAIYIGFALFVFWGTKWLKCCLFNLRPFFYLAALFLVIMQGLASLKHPLLEPKSSYARSCTDLYSSKCDPAFYK